MMGDVARGQVTRNAAETYEKFFVPALFGQWGPRVVEAVDLRAGERVLDVACGTGVLARTAGERVGPEGSIVGLDPNPGMLAVAREAAPGIDWRRGSAESIPFDDGSFDAVVSQFGLMFFDDGVGAIREMARVTRPGGRIAVAVWDTLENTPGYDAVARLLQRLFGERAAAAIRVPYSLGDKARVRALFDDAGIPDATIATHDGNARFDSIESWVHTDVKGWTLADMIDDEQYELLRGEAVRELARFVGDDGTVSFPAPAHIVTAPVV
jgi:ubiquinone/menaquinone biosynthesis C-methylase UbiE